VSEANGGMTGGSPEELQQNKRTDILSRMDAKQVRRTFTEFFTERGAPKRPRGTEPRPFRSAFVLAESTTISTKLVALPGT